MEKIGLLAGNGKLPVEFVRAARGMGICVFVVALVEDFERDLEQCAEKFQMISIGQLDAIIQYFKENQIAKVTMLGKVTKELMFSGTVKPDQRISAILASLPDYSDDTLMLAFVRELAKEGMQVFDQTALIRKLMVEEGTLTKNSAPTQREKEDIEFGFKMAKAIGGLDIGQTVVVKDAAVLAVEAIEGTDACILRGGKLGRGGAVAVKVAKPKQDMRFDMPAVGVKTIESMIEADVRVLALEAGKTLLVEREKVLALADKNGITIVAL